MTDKLAEQLAATAAGTWGEEAAIWLLAEHGHWLPQLDQLGLITTDAEYPHYAEADYGATRSRLHELTGTGSEFQVLYVALTLAGESMPFSGLSSLDEQNRRRVLHAIAWAMGGRAWAEQNIPVSDR